jgi:hypothetical protein
MLKMIADILDDTNEIKKRQLLMVNGRWSRRYECVGGIGTTTLAGQGWPFAIVPEHWKHW